MDIEQFQAYRPLLFSIAYRMLGSAADAEDVVQEAYLRVQGRDETIDTPKYYLTTVVTRLCLNQLSSARAKREEYLGPWLPEPIVTEPPSELDNPARRMATYDSLSIAFLTLLEALSPAERAVFLLHEVFGYSHQEIGQMLEKTSAACRQLLRRAKKHIAQNRPRFKATPEQHERLLHRFIEVGESGEMDAFLDLLAEDVTFVPDGGGQRGAAIRVLRGRQAVGHFIGGVRRLMPPGGRYEFAWLNGERALLARTAEGRPFFALFIQSDGQQVHLIHVIAGEKLAAISERLGDWRLGD